MDLIDPDGINVSLTLIFLPCSYLCYLYLVYLFFFTASPPFFLPLPLPVLYLYTLSRIHTYTYIYTTHASALAPISLLPLLSWALLSHNLYPFIYCYHLYHRHLI